MVEVQSMTTVADVVAAVREGGLMISCARRLCWPRGS